jgi:hypothetical protein
VSRERCPPSPASRSTTSSSSRAWPEPWPGDPRRWQRRSLRAAHRSLRQPARRRLRFPPALAVRSRPRVPPRIVEERCRCTHECFVAPSVAFSPSRWPHLLGHVVREFV